MSENDKEVLTPEEQKIVDDVLKAVSTFIGQEVTDTEHVKIIAVPMLMEDGKKTVIFQIVFFSMDHNSKPITCELQWLVNTIISATREDYESLRPKHREFGVV